jgi:hypothetical protein
MNKVLAAILTGVEKTAAAAVPGGTAIDSAIHGLVKHDGDVNTNILNAAEGAIQAVEAIKEAEIIDEVKFRAGVATIEAGLSLVRQALKVTPAV